MNEERGEYLNKLKEELEVHIYQRFPEEDVKLLTWWNRLVETNELDLLFSEELHNLGAFLGWFQNRNNILAYKLNKEDEIILAVWTEPFSLRARYINTWVDKEARKSPNVFKAMQLMYTVAHELWGVLIGLTRKELLDTHIKLGYTVHEPPIRGLLREDIDTYLVSLTPQEFKKSKLYLKEVQ